jgi:rod shape-determining protein MreC
MLVRNNYYQQAKFFIISKDISGSIQTTFNNITQYFSLAKTNKELADFNSRLLNLSMKSYVKIDTGTYIINDTLYKQEYKFLSAKVVNNSINRRNNYLTLNKGRNDSIENDMAVITSDGIVGIVKSVSANFASVISVLNSKIKISAKIKKNNYIGTLIWEGMDYRKGILKDIPSHAVLTKGDTIVTSGFSNIFPEGITIGTILYYKKDEGGNFYTIYVKFSNDMNKLNYVYVIKYLHKKEQTEIERATQND